MYASFLQWIFFCCVKRFFVLSFFYKKSPAPEYGAGLKVP